MITTLSRSQTLAALPNSRLNTPMVPGPQTSWVISKSALTQTLSPACTCPFPAARASIFSVSVIDRKPNWRTGRPQHANRKPEDQFALPLALRVWYDAILLCSHLRSGPLLRTYGAAVEVDSLDL